MGVAELGCASALPSKKRFLGITLRWRHIPLKKGYVETFAGQR
jgi:hypothetical protein